VWAANYARLLIEDCRRKGWAVRYADGKLRLERLRPGVPSLGFELRYWTLREFRRDVRKAVRRPLSTVAASGEIR
jgi:hypothetical protein